MAKGFKTGAGVGTFLNFKVVGGTTEPVNPKENTIWVNTDKEIKNWEFSAKQPAEPTEGMVWFYTAPSSAFKFNALKKNTLMVYPITSKQFNDGEWVDVASMLYQDNKWIEWFDYLYNLGNEFSDLTGGWTSKNGTAYVHRGITKNANSITCSISKYDARDEEDSLASTVKAIDLSDYNVITVRVVNYSNKDSDGYNQPCAICRFGVYSSSIGSPAAIKAFYGTGDVSLDVSSLSGPYYVFFGVNSAWDSKISNYATVTFDSMKMI